VSWRLFRRRRRSRSGAGTDERGLSLIGYTLLLRRSDNDQEGAEMLSALAKHYEVSLANDEDRCQGRFAGQVLPRSRRPDLTADTGPLGRGK
jgi:hypothetical protein